MLAGSFTCTDAATYTVAYAVAHAGAFSHDDDC
jgi:hypothetical protein